MQYDYIVIGAGSGGLSSARRAAHYGAKVLIVENGHVGGTCVNVGCVPKKVMWNAGYVAEVLRDAEFYGFQFSPPQVDWSALKKRRDAYLGRIHESYDRMFAKTGIQLLRGTAKFVDAKTVEVDGTRYTAPHILIATGGRPMIPNLPGAELGISSDGFFELDHLPKKVAVVGGGYIASELAGIFRELGSEVHLLVRGEKLLTNFDPVLGEAVGAAYCERGIQVRTATTITGVESKSGKITLKTEPDQDLGALDCLVWATGRTPNIETINIDSTKVKLDAQNFIAIDEFQNTTQPGVYAVGDVTNRPALTPVAIAAGKALSDRLFDGQTDRKVDYGCVPTVVFTNPPIGSVGLTESEAIKKYGEKNLRIYHSEFIPTYFAVTSRKPRSKIKMITRLPEETIVGLHLFGAGSDEMLQGFTVAIQMGATKKDFDRTIAIHPTAAEEVVTIP